MKNKKFMLLIVAMIAAMALILTSCGSSPKTIEDYSKTDSDFQAEMAQIEEQNQGLHLSFSGNTVIYDFNFQEMGSYTESQVVNDTVKANLEKALTDNASQFSTIIANMEDESEITGIEMVVNYKWGDTLLATATFDKNGKK